MAFQSELCNFYQKGAATKGNLLFGTSSNLTVCSINRTYIHVEVGCIKATPNHEIFCSALRARHSEGLPISSMEPTFDSNATGSAPSNILSAIPYILPSLHAGDQSSLEAWLADPLKAGIGGFMIQDHYTGLPPGVFDARLTVILNTALRGSYRSDIILGTDGTDPGNYTYDAQVGYSDRFGNTTGHWSAYSKSIYRVHLDWLSLYLLSIAVLFVSATGAFSLRMRIRAPDFLSSVSALTRDSPYIRTPPGGSTIDGTQMAKALGGKRVKIGDVDSDDVVGRTAFAEVDMVRSRALRKDRLHM